MKKRILAALALIVCLAVCSCDAGVIAPVTTTVKDLPDSIPTEIITSLPDDTTDTPAESTAEVTSQSTTSAVPVTSEPEPEAPAGKLKVYISACVNKTDGSHSKSDGFIFVYGDEVLLMDGGSKDHTAANSTYNYLMKIRQEFIREGKIKDTDKLKINLIITHMHGDHVGALLNPILPSSYFKVGNVYMYETSAFAKNASFKSYSASFGDTKYGDELFSLLDKNHSGYVLHRIGFGKTETIKSKDGRVTYKIYGSSRDWGAGTFTDKSTNLGYIVSKYYSNYTNSTAISGIPTAICNANSLWLKVTYGDDQMLFTADEMKKKDNATDEPLDCMIKDYGASEFMNCDLVKFLHHGMLRNPAIYTVITTFKPDIIVCTMPDQTVSSASGLGKTAYVGFIGRGGVMYDTLDGLEFETEGKGITCTHYGTTSKFDTSHPE